MRGGYLIPAAVLLFSGILLHAWMPSPEWGTFGLVVLLGVAWWRYARGHSIACQLAAALVLAGSVRGGLHARSRQDAEAFLSGLPAEGIAVSIRGRVVPGDGGGDLEADGRRLRFELRSAQLWLDGRRLRLDESVRVSLFGTEGRRPRAGEVWHLDGRLRVRDSAGVRFRGWPRLTMTGDLDRAARLRTGLDWLDLPSLLAARAGMARLLSRGIEDAPEVNAVIGAVVLGYRTALPPETREIFRRTGTAHVFAISGLHVGILCALLVGLLRYVQFPRMLWVLPLAPLVTGYAVLTGGRPSALRACLMAVCYFAAPLFGRRPRVGSALGAAALILVAYDPGQLLDPGFIFSFIVVGGIVALMPLFEPWLTRLAGTDPMLPPDMADDDGRAWRRRVLRYVGALAGVSLAAWISSAPLTAYYFNRFSFVALPANLLAVPLAFLILLTSVMSLIAGSCVAWLGVVLNHTNLLLVTVQTGIMRLLAALPGASVAVPSPPVWLTAGYYGILLGMAMGLRAGQRQVTLDVADEEG